MTKEKPLLGRIKVDQQVLYRKPSSVSGKCEKSFSKDFKPGQIGSVSTSMRTWVVLLP
jgi:hypothetical protein